MPFYENGDIRIHYEEAGSGFPLLVIPGGGLNSTIAGLATHPFNPFDEFKNEFRVISADLRNAPGGESSGPLEVDRPWDTYTDESVFGSGSTKVLTVHGTSSCPSRFDSGPCNQSTLAQEVALKAIPCNKGCDLWRSCYPNQMHAQP